MGKHCFIDSFAAEKMKKNKVFALVIVLSDDGFIQRERQMRIMRCREGFFLFFKGF